MHENSAQRSSKKKCCERQKTENDDRKKRFSAIFSNAPANRNNAYLKEIVEVKGRTKYRS